MTVIKKITEERYQEAIELSEYAFQYKVTPDQMEERVRLLKKHHQLFGIIEEDKLVAKLHFLPLEINLGDKLLKMGGIAGVATYPEYRRSGFVHNLLIHTLNKMKEEGYSLSMLHPFSVPFYRKYGWELFSNKHVVTLKKSDLRFQKSTLGNMKRFSKNPPLEDLQIVYSAYAKTFSGMLKRAEDWWEKLVKNQQIAVYYDEQKEPCGYICYQIANMKMEVEEFVALNGEARRGLWNFICQHDSMVEELEMTLYENEPLLFSLEEPRFKRTITPYFMARIVDVESFLKMYDFNWSDSATEIVLKIDDPHASWNNQSFSITKNGVTVVDDGHKEITLSINALTALLLGYQSWQQLLEIEQIQGSVSDLERFANIIPKRVPFFYDFF